MPSIRSVGKHLLVVAVLGCAGIAQAADSVDALAQDVERIESLRQVKDLQRLYTHLANAGLWNEMGAVFIHGAETVTGSTAIAKWLTARQGGGRQGLAPGALHFEVIDQPLANLAVDGRSARVRYNGLLLQGDGKDNTRIEGGIYENEYVRDGNTWKISVSHYWPQYDGSYARGWRNTGNADLPIVPYHFTLDETGIPLPAAPQPAPRSKVTLAALEARIAKMGDEAPWEC